MSFACVRLLMVGEMYERDEVLHYITALSSEWAGEEGGPELAAILAVVIFRIVFANALERAVDLHRHRQKDRREAKTADPAMVQRLKSLRGRLPSPTQRLPISTICR
jgi:hypothetical protein